ncbi:hypothetical protein H9L39_02339, partial [Fusarium oxysporum f. sp. albedinis]
FCFLSNQFEGTFDRGIELWESLCGSYVTFSPTTPSAKPYTEYPEELCIDVEKACQTARNLLSDCIPYKSDMETSRLKLVTRKIEAVIRLLEQIDHSFNTYSNSTSNEQSTLPDSLRHHMYGPTPMRQSLERTTRVFRSYPAQQQAPVLVSNGQ